MAREPISNVKTRTYEPLYIYDSGQFRLGRPFSTEGALDLYISSAELPDTARYVVRLRRDAGVIAYRATGGAWITVRSVFEVPRPEVSAFRPRRAVLARKARAA